jgi:hypothetical protein
MLEIILIIIIIWYFAYLDAAGRQTVNNDLMNIGTTMQTGLKNGYNNLMGSASTSTATTPTAAPTQENFDSGCSGDCDNLRVPNGNFVALNPFVWPYSAQPCIDDINRLDPAAKLYYGFNNKPLVHQTMPDHTLLM